MVPRSSRRRFDTNINQLRLGRPEGARDHRSQWSLNFVQPLARDAGTAVTAALVAYYELALRIYERHLEIRDLKTQQLLRTHTLAERPGTVVLPDDERVFNPSR